MIRIAISSMYILLDIADLKAVSYTGNEKILLATGNSVLEHSEMVHYRIKRVRRVGHLYVRACISICRRIENQKVCNNVYLNHGIEINL